MTECGRTLTIRIVPLFFLGNHPTPILGPWVSCIVDLLSHPSSSRVLMWPGLIRALQVPGHSDWFRGRHLTQARLAILRQRNSIPDLLLEPLRKKHIFFSGVDERMAGGHLCLSKRRVSEVEPTQREAEYKERDLVLTQLILSPALPGFFRYRFA